ncbi:unnamed protein product [Schistosoma haematobium]|nr:unnamed protein product [Schistosoma haematobium]
MGRNKKKQSQTIPLVPTSQNKRARRKKAKKLKKNLEGTNSIISNMPSIKVNESKKSKKRRFLKEQQQQQQKASVLTNSNVKITNKKRAGFGEASSESDSEPIEADWGSANDHSDNDDEQWQSEENVTRSFTNSNDDDEQSDSGSSNNDLEESEEDEDEELSENELNTLIQSQKKPMTKDTSKQKISGPKKKPLKRTRESVENTPTSAKKMKIVGESKQSIVKPLDKGDDHQVSVSYSWKNESIIIEEIKKRAIELSSATLHVSPLPPDHNESMLKSLSPSMMSYRFSIRKNKRIRDFVFLQYVDADTAEAARKSVSGRLFAGKTISAQPNRLSFPISDLKLDNINRTQLFVTGFNSSTTKNDLIHIFPKGTVDFPLTIDGMTCGYAVIKFVNENVSLEAFSTTHKRLVRGLPIFVNFIFSRSKVIDQKQNNDENQLKANKSKNDQSLDKMKEKQLNKPSSSSSLEKTSNIVIQKTTVNTKDIGNKQKGSNTKVLVQQLPESENDSKSSASDESNDESKTDELFVHQTKNRNSTTSKTSVLNDLVSSKMLKVSPKKKSKSEMSKLDDDEDDSDGQDDDDDDDDDDEDNEDLDDEDEISEYDEDDSGTEEEDDDEDVDDDDDDDEDDEDEEDLGDTDSDDASEDSDEVVKNDSKQKNTVNNKNKPSPLKDNSQIISVDEEQASSADGNNSSDEEIDKQLMTVIQAKRSAKKSFKSPKNAKRNLNSAKHSGKKSQPQWLRVPETMKGKKK